MAADLKSSWRGYSRPIAIPRLPVLRLLGLLHVMLNEEGAAAVESR